MFCFTHKLTCNKCGRVKHKATVCKTQSQHNAADTSRFSSKNSRAKTANNDRSQSRSQSRGRCSSHHVKDTETQDVSDASNHVDDSTSSSIMTVHSIVNVPPITYYVEVNGLPITLELDSGCCYSLLNSEHWKQLGKPELTKGPELRDVLRNAITVLGIAYVDVRLQEQHKRLRVVFIDRPDTASLLGREWIAKFNLLTVQQATPQVSKSQIAQQTSPNLENLLSKCKDLFDNANFPSSHGFKAHLHVIPDAQYRLFKPRPVPYALKSLIVTELEILERLGIISKVAGAELSTTPIVPALMLNGQVRICGDFKVTVNRYLDLTQYPLPHSEEIC